MRRRTALVLTGVVGVVVAIAAAGSWFSPLRTSRASGERAPAVSSTTTTTTTLPEIPARHGINSPPIFLENQRTGTDLWRISRATPGAIEGYALTVSAQAGEQVPVAVSTVDPTFHVEAYRMGWYQGLGARLVWQSPEIAGASQPEPVADPVTGMVEAQWEPSVILPTDANWPQGDYLLKLVGSSGNQQYVPLTLRADAEPSAFLVVNAVTTWQAYNVWGGCSLYHCRGGGTRANVVSFDRPYGWSEGSADYIGNEFPVLRRLEEWGLDVTYTTDVDVHRHPELLLQHKAVLTMGHDEYWSKAMRDGMEAARDAGVNLVFFGANAAYRQIRFEPSATGPDRHQVNYRSSADPIRATDPDQTTVSFRESPVNRPENTLIGQQYECNPVRADMVVSDAASWVFANTGVTDGQQLEIVVGSEYDRWSPGPGVPENVEILAHSPVTCRGRRSFADMTYYTAPSGAGVFATGTNYWVSKHDPPAEGSPYNPTIIQITRNVLEVFGAGPAGVTHPSVANAAAIAGG
ncbi:MAG: N,N-dimethylformamidase beta subunit family domain-containing protein [Acidimicrobiia bacterium]